MAYRRRLLDAWLDELLAELPAILLVGPSAHLAWMRDGLGDRFIGSVVFPTGPHVFPLGERITALPISAIWAAR